MVSNEERVSGGGRKRKRGEEVGGVSVRWNYKGDWIFVGEDKI